jgi:hypothetical protein
VVESFLLQKSSVGKLKRRCNETARQLAHLADTPQHRVYAEYPWRGGSQATCFYGKESGITTEINVIALRLQNNQAWGTIERVSVDGNAAHAGPLFR